MDDLWDSLERAGILAAGWLATGTPAVEKIRLVEGKKLIPGGGYGNPRILATCPAEGKKLIPGRLQGPQNPGNPPGGG